MRGHDDRLNRLEPVVNQSLRAPSYLKSEWYDEKTRKLKKGAPKKLVDEYNAYQEPSDEVLDEELIRPKRTSLTEEDIKNLLKNEKRRR